MNNLQQMRNKLRQKKKQENQQKLQQLHQQKPKDENLIINKTENIDQKQSKDNNKVKERKLSRQLKQIGAQQNNKSKLQSMRMTLRNKKKLNLIQQEKKDPNIQQHNIHNVQQHNINLIADNKTKAQQKMIKQQQNKKQSKLSEFQLMRAKIREKRMAKKQLQNMKDIPNSENNTQNKQQPQKIKMNLDDNNNNIKIDASLVQNYQQNKNTQELTKNDQKQKYQEKQKQEKVIKEFSFNSNINNQKKSSESKCKLQQMKQKMKIKKMKMKQQQKQKQLKQQQQKKQKERQYEKLETKLIQQKQQSLSNVNKTLDISKFMIQQSVDQRNNSQQYHREQLQVQIQALNKNNFMNQNQHTNNLDNHPDNLVDNFADSQKVYNQSNQNKFTKQKQMDIQNIQHIQNQNSQQQFVKNKIASRNLNFNLIQSNNFQQQPLIYNQLQQYSNNNNYNQQQQFQYQLPQQLFSKKYQKQRKTIIKQAIKLQTIISQLNYILHPLINNPNINNTHQQHQDQQNHSETQNSAQQIQYNNFLFQPIDTQKNLSKVHQIKSKLNQMKLLLSFVQKK